MHALSEKCSLSNRLEFEFGWLKSKIRGDDDEP
jgi:hypothetical protein